MSRAHRHLGARRIVGVVLASLLAIHVGRALTGASGPLVELVVDDLVYNALILAAAVLCLARAATRADDRPAWAAFGAGMLLWSAGEITWTLSSIGGEPPIPSAADVLWIAFYPAMYAGLVLLVRSHTRDFRPSIWLDGLTAALGAAAVGAAMLVPAIQAVATSGSSAIETATNLAYPLGDLILLALVVGMLPLLGWRPPRMWAFLGAGLLAMALADAAYLSDVAGASYVAGGLLENLWPAAALLLVAAAWAPRSEIATVRRGSIATLAPTVVAALAAILILVADHFERFSGLAIVLAAATLMAVVVRAVLAFRENDRVLERLSVQALADPLTGLGNRRALVQRLEETLGHPPGAGSWLLLLFDLDGFKGYNDAFGHPAGDALLERLGSRLGTAAGPRGRAYRLGGDEFCVLAPVEGTDTEALIDATSRALQAEGEGFCVVASLGAVFLPDEATSVSGAFGVADRRLYTAKRARRVSADWQTQRALSQAIREREPDLLEHVKGVVELAVEVARRMGLRDGDLEEVARAAALHDVGKLAIPDEILRKPGPLTVGERALMQRHPIIGERILAAAPALAGVSRIVRHSHERWDGDGYPDRLAREEIPLVARIVAACDAFHAMTSDRPYREARDTHAALAELQNRGGTQFDPRVSGILRDVVLDRELAGATHTPPPPDVSRRAPGSAPSPRRRHPADPA